MRRSGDQRLLEVQMMSDADQNRNAEAVMEFQRAIVGEVLGDMPEVVAETAPDEDMCDTVAACARTLAHAVVGNGLAPDFEDTVVEATVIHALAASAVRWGECGASVNHPEVQGRLIARMVSETQSAPYRARAISGEFRMAPWRAREVLNYRLHCVDGRVDFDSWTETSGDPEFVRNLQAIFARD